MKPYPAYKDSGVEWIGEIPEHWEIKKLSYLTNIQGRIGFKGYTKSDLVAEGEGALTLGGKHINSNNRLNLSDAEYISWDKYYESPEIMVKKNNIIVSQRGTLGKVLLIEDDIGEATINPSLVLLNNIKIYEKFLYYFLTSDYICKKVELNNTATAVPMISQEQLSSFKILIPSIFEQHLVSNFLDHKTSQIDTLIEKKQKQIELLKEERTAIINQAVTKGLNPDVPMKDSGIEWVGKIPTNWEVEKLRRLFEIHKNIAGEEGYSVLSITQKGIVIRDITINDGQLSQDYSKYQFVKVGDFAMNHMDLLTGWIDISSFEGVTSPDYRVFCSINQNIIDKYYLYFFQNCYTRKIFYGHGQGVSNFGRWRLQTDKFLNFLLTVPPIDEQLRIVTYLDEKTASIDNSIGLIEQSLKYLYEYRIALISEAVTGKIDVREYHGNST